MDRRETQSVRKKYDKPSLVSYGNIRQVAQAIAMNSKVADGGTGDKTA